MGDISLVDGWVPILVFVLAPLTLVLGFGWRSGAWKKQLIVGAIAVAVYLPLIYVLNENFHLIQYEFPTILYVWSAIPVFTLAVAVTGWRRDGAFERIFSVVAILLSLVLVGELINRHFRYYPTIAALGGKVAENEVHADDLGKLKEEAKQAKQLPAHGSTVPVTIPPGTSGFQTRPSYVWLPPVYFADPQPELPVLVMLHGIPGDPADWERAGLADQVADAFASQHGGRAPILVFPDYAGAVNGQDTQCADSPRGKAETFLTVDLPAYMQSTFHASKDRSEWGVVGFSTGAFCALQLTLRHPEVFRLGAVFSGDTKPTLDAPASALKEIFGGNQQAFDQYDATKILQSKKYTNTDLWIESGAQDGGPTGQSQALFPLLTPAGVDGCLLVRPGGHDFAFWEQAFTNSLPWMSAKLGLTPMPPAVAGAQCTPDATKAPDTTIPINT